MACGGMSLQQQFVNFSKFGDEKSDGTTITLTQSDKWMKQAKILDGKKITLTDTGVAFNKFKKRTINFAQYLKFLENLAEEKNLDLLDLKEKLADCGLPGSTNQGDNKPNAVGLPSATK